MPDTLKSPLWTLGEIIEFLEINGGSILIREGKTLVGFPHLPKGRERDLQSKILPHLKRRKAEVLEHYYGITAQNHISYPSEPPRPIPDSAGLLESLADAFKAQAAEEAAESKRLQEIVQAEQNPVLQRAKALKALHDRSAANNGTVIYLKRNGLACAKHADETRKIKYYRNGKVAWRTYRIPLSREATHAALIGDADWTPLAKVTTPDEDAALAPKRKKKSGRFL